MSWFVLADPRVLRFDREVESHTHPADVLDIHNREETTTKKGQDIMVQKAGGRRAFGECFDIRVGMKDTIKLLQRRHGATRNT